MARARFSQGQSTFKCHCCGRRTRDTGDNGSLELCPECFELAGCDNMHNDDDGTIPTPEEMKGYETLLSLIAEKGGDTQAVKDSCGYIWS